ncbi:hypothetical protein [Syntrophorhabdus aromaticivorans]|uniref:hypothetical protein n=1 Tax=Syntrophorhabdus aromaticivorans TaxID=328301 RepID=UPI00056D9E86|nr:hypothetical protein [Syntrophorhabdus aromaticivorans]
MHVTAVPNRTSPPAMLIRESYREGGKVKTRTIANITKRPKRRVDLLKKPLILARLMIRGSRCKAVREGRTVQLVVDEKARTGVAALDGCYVIKSDVPRDKADRETLHARYKDLAFVERDFRDMKTAHLDERRSRYLAALGVTLPKRLVSPKRAHVR